MPTTEITECPLAGTLANRLRVARADLTKRWLDRIVARVSIEPNRVFPSDALLDHVPLLVDGIADYLENPADEISADIPVVAKAMELGELRHAQGFDAYEIMKEYEILGGILFSFVVQAVEETDTPCGRGEMLECGHRLYRAVAVIQQTTVTHYLRVANERINEREQRLRSFNHAISHELKNHLGAVIGAGDILLSLDGLEDGKRKRFATIVVKNAKEMQGTLESLLDLSRLDQDSRRQRHVLLPRAVAEVVRQLREATGARHIAVRVSDDLPDVEVNAAAVELCLTNYISNAIKYVDRSKGRSWVEISGSAEVDEEGRCSTIIVRVQDNGLGVPEEARTSLFQRFFRAHEETVTGVDGTGLGLSIVRETVEAVGGRAWAEFPEEGSVFSFSMPCRRDEDTAQTP